MTTGSADGVPGRQRGRGRPRKALDGADLGPERLAFVAALRTVFFDRLKDEGVTYAEISQRLGADYSLTTLSRIASGRKLPEYEQLVALVALVPHLVGQPLTEKAEEHLWQLYLRAVGVKNPEHVPYYQYLRDVARARERQQAMVAIRASHPLPANGEEDDPDAVQLRDDAAALLHQVARAGIPLPPQPLVTPPPGASRPPAVDALLDQTDHALRRHLAPLESEGFVSADETDPSPPEPAGVSQPAPSPSGPLWGFSTGAAGRASARADLVGGPGGRLRRVRGGLSPRAPAPVARRRPPGRRQQRRHQPPGWAVPWWYDNRWQRRWRSASAQREGTENCRLFHRSRRHPDRHGPAVADQHRPHRDHHRSHHRPGRRPGPGRLGRERLPTPGRGRLLAADRLHPQRGRPAPGHGRVHVASRRPADRPRSPGPPQAR